MMNTLSQSSLLAMRLTANRFASSFHGVPTSVRLYSILRAIVPLNSNWYGSGIRSGTSLSLRSLRGITSLPGHAKLKDNGTSNWRKQTSSNCHQNSPPPFDICQSKIDFPISPEAVESEMYQPGAGDVLRRGMVLLKRFFTLDEQVSIVNKCRRLGLGPGGFYRPGFKSGAKLRLMMMCLGLDWNPQTSNYSKIRHIDNSRPPEIPHQFTAMVKRAMVASQDLTKSEYESSNVEAILPMMSPDVCIVNFYNTVGRLGLHQDKDESKWSLGKGLPVVSVSVGDSAEFLYGDDRDMNKVKSVVLESGDVLVFGGKSRHVFHGVQSVIPGTAPESLLKKTGLRPGRLNLTFRQF